MNQRSTPYRLSTAFEGEKSRELVRDISQGLGKMPPQSLELEEAILGAVMMESNAFPQIVELLQPDDFYSDQHKEIYNACLQLFKSSEPIDMRTVVAKLRTNGKIEVAGGAFYIAELTSKIASAANIEYHARLIIEYSIKRQMIGIASYLHHDAYDDTSDAIELLGNTQAKFDKVGGQYLKGNMVRSRDAAKKFLKNLVDQRDRKGITGVPSGFQRLDHVLAGFQNSDLILVAARPGVGKTGWLLSSALNQCIRFQIPVGIFSLEMSERQLMARAHSSESNVSNERILKNYFSDEELYQMGDASQKIQDSLMLIDDTPSLSIIEFRARARKMVKEEGAKILYVDYVQLMQGEKGGTRDQEIGSISSMLKRVAKELNVPVIALSQLSRAVETRGGDKRPTLADLRESGNLEQDADIVLFLYRAEYYKIMQDDEGNSTQGVMEVIIAKHRNGSLDTIPLKFIGKYTKVTDWDSMPVKQEIPQNLKPLNSGIRLPYPDKDEPAPF